MYVIPCDVSGTIIKIGDRVRILCDENKSFFRKIGITILLRKHEYRYAPTVFVQMVTSGGGVWWHGGNLRIQPKLKPCKRPKRS